MKKLFTTILSKPKTTVPLFTLIALAISALVYVHIGVAPVIPEDIKATDTEKVMTSGNNISLSFPKSGRISSVSFKNGDVVKAGDIIAKLSAPDAEGAVSQAKGALDLARAQFSLLSTDYANTKKQQDILVANAYRKLLTTDLFLTPDQKEYTAIAPTITGTYNGSEGQYKVDIDKPNVTLSDFRVRTFGIETSQRIVDDKAPTPLGTKGLYINFPVKDLAQYQDTSWYLDIPNKSSSSYLENKNDYDLAVNTREKVLSDLADKIGSNDSGSVAKAQVDAALGAYQAALGAYQNNVITSPVSGVITFMDPNLKVGQSVNANKSVISITIK